MMVNFFDMIGGKGLREKNYYYLQVWNRVGMIFPGHGNTWGGLWRNAKKWGPRAPRDLLWKRSQRACK